MNEPKRNPPTDYRELPCLTFRQLEVFRVVCREGSYSNAALELRSTRSNIKRVCEDFQNAVGRTLFDEGPERNLLPTPFAKALLAQVTPLSRNLRLLGECVKSLHEKGRILRFAAAGGFFKGGLFTDFLARLKISDTFRPCFLRIETNRFRTALLNSECDVYFGASITPSDRLERVNLGPIPWSFKTGAHYCGKSPQRPADLIDGKWWIAETGDPEAGEAMLAKFHAAGAAGGRILREPSAAEDEIVLTPEITSPQQAAKATGMPSFQLTAILKKQHPYSELRERILGAAIA